MKWVLGKDGKVRLACETEADFGATTFPVSVSVVYVYPHFLGESTRSYGRRFLETYCQFPPGYPHETVVVLNNSKLTPELRLQFSPLMNCRFIQHDDSGWDIGAFQRAARECSSELMVFMGTSVYLKGQHWLLRMVEATQRRGAGLYGCHGNRGAKLMPRYHDVYPHVRTTGFWIGRELFNRYPMKVTRQEQRYEFEHGKYCLAEWVKSQGLKTWVVTWGGEYQWENWDVRNGYQNGDQSQLLLGDRLTEPPFYWHR